MCCFVASFEKSVTMSGQMKLSSFFKPSPKRLSADSLQKSPKKLKVDKENDDGSPNSPKKIKNENDQTTPSKGTDILKVQPTSSILQNANHQIIEVMESYAEKYSVLDRRIGPSWFKALKGEFEKPYFKKLSDFVTSERMKHTVYPPAEHVWNWTRQCSIDSVKVVILGQDPYHNPGQAHGLCFSVPVGVPPPPSLLNMYKELETDIVGFKNPKHGYLVGWARQGVLLLNAVLSVKKNAPNSHKDQGWEELTSAVIKYINENNKGVVFLLWGAYAQKKADFVDKKKHCVLKTVHPSPLSASRGFFGCKHFSKCNEYLESQDKRPVDWCRLPEK